MEDVELWHWLSHPMTLSLCKAALLLCTGLFVLPKLTRLLERSLPAKIPDQTRMILAKAVRYLGLFLIIMMALNQMGLSMGPLLGAAGIMGMALGFASQASVSNVISGLFLLTERSFVIGDIVQLGETKGTVLSIDLLSVKLKTFDNRLVRIPNEKMIQSEMTNITRFPNRRFDITLGVAYKEDIGRVIQVLRQIIQENPHCLKDPEPLVAFTGFGDSSLEIQLGVWFMKDDFLVVRATLLPRIKEAFDAENIEIPFPHLTLYTGAVTDPFPVSIESAKA